MTLLQHHLLALGLIFTTTAVLGALILWKNPRMSTNRIFAFYTFSLTWWSLWEFLAQFSPSHIVAVHRLQIEYFGVCLIPTLFYHGAARLAGVRRSLEFLACYLLSAVFILLIAVMRHPLFIPDAVPVAYLPYWGKAGSLYGLFLAFFTVTVIRTHQTLWKSFRREPPGLRRKQLRYLFFSSAMAYIAAIPEFTLKLGIRIPLLQPYGLYSVPLYAILITYAIVQFKLFDINVVIRKSLIYSILVTSLTVGYFGLIYLAEDLFQARLGYRSTTLSMIAFGLMALLFQPLKIGIQRLVDWIMFRTKHEDLVRKVERLEEQAVQAEKFKAVSTLAAGMAHEIKNPLTAIKTFAEFLPERHQDPEFIRQCHQTLSHESSRIGELVRDLLQFAKPRSPRLRPVDLAAVISSTVNLLSAELLKRNIRWTIDCRHNGATLQADPDQLRQVLINLIQNAADAMPKGGSLTLATQSVNSHIELTVRDTGQGIPPTLLPKIFDPFVSTKPDGNGLGLAVVYSILRAHRGSIRADSRPGQGTTFTVELTL